MTTDHTPPADQTTELTAEEARALADELGTDLYRAQDALAFVGECCDIADREQRPITTAQVREWLKGARCGRQLLADTAEQAALRDRIATALEQADYRMDMRRGDLADAVLAVLPPPADRAAILHETADAVAQMHIGAEDPNPDDHVRGYNNALEHVVAGLRRMADETQPAEAQPESCAHCGKNILRITGTLTAWWVHAPGGHTICDPKQAASSPRATPKPAAERQDGAARDEVVHGCPPDGSGLTPCCGRTPFELPRTDRISSEAPPTCTGNGPRQDGAQP